MVFRNKDPCQPCRAKKIRCIHNIQQIPSPKPVVSPGPALTPRKTRQVMEKPLTVNLGNTPVFENQKGLDALATISNNNLGARDNTPDLLETCNTMPVVIPRKRRLFRESPPAKFIKKQKLDGSPTDTFEAEIKVSVPAWITEKLKTIPDFRGPMGPKKSGLKDCRKNLRPLFGNTHKPVVSSNSSVHSASEKEENLRPAKPSLDSTTSEGGSPRTTTPIEMIDDNRIPSIGETPEHDLKIKGAMGSLSLMSPSTSIKGGLQNLDVGNPVETEAGDALSVQALQEDPDKSAEAGKGESGMVQEVESRLDEYEPKEASSLTVDKGPEGKVNGPVEREPHQPKTTQDVEKATPAFKQLGGSEDVMMNNGAMDDNISGEGNHRGEDPVVTAIDEQGGQLHEEQKRVVSNPKGSASQEPGLQAIITLDNAVGGEINDEHDYPGSTEGQWLKDTTHQALMEIAREESAQAILHIQQSQDSQEGPEESESNVPPRLPGLSPAPYDNHIAPVQHTGVLFSPGLTPWNRTPIDGSLASSGESVNGHSTGRELWRKEHSGSATLPSIDRTRWRDSSAGPSRFSGPRIVTPLRSAPLEPGMGLVDTKRYSQHEGLWNMVTNDYLGKFRRVSKKKEEGNL